MSEAVLSLHASLCEADDCLVALLREDADGDPKRGTVKLEKV